MKHMLASVIIATTAAPALADGYEPVKDEQRFVALIEDKELRNLLYGVRMKVRKEGTIEGSAVGWPIAGTWAWQDGYFCREMTWGDDPIPFNCQLVEVRDDTRLRFTVDRGAGDSATFRLR